MFFHIFKYNLRSLLRNKQGTFWIAVFPIVMSLFFYLTFGQVDNTSADIKFERIPVAVFNNDKNEGLLSAMDDSELFTIEKVTQDNAEKLLSDAKVDAIIDAETYAITTGKSGLMESITKLFVDRYSQTTNAVTDVIKANETNPAFLENPQAFVADIVATAEQTGGFVTQKPVREGNNIVIFFYALIGMAVLMGSTNAADVVVKIQANASTFAARQSVSPVKKSLIFNATLLSTMLFHIISVCLAVLFINYVLGVTIPNLPLTLPLVAMACINANFLGAVLSAMLKKKQSLTTGILISVTMFLSFAAGMMSNQIKYAFDLYVPFINWLNPAALVVDGLYALYYYDSVAVYLIALAKLTILSVITAIATSYFVRERRYADI